MAQFIRILPSVNQPIWIFFISFNDDFPQLKSGCLSAITYGDMFVPLLSFAQF